MATARDDLKEVSGEESPPTIEEALAEIGRDPDKYGNILDESGPKFAWEEVYKPESSLETGALTLLTAARQSGAEPEEYLSRLAPYFDSKVEYLPRLLNALGMVELENPDTAIVTETTRQLGRMGKTLPHELEHTLQKTRKDAPGFREVSRFSNISSDDTTLRFGTWDGRYDDLQERVDALPEEQKESITGGHPVFGAYLYQGDELMARLRAAEMLEAARGGDFYQSEMGQALLPTDDDKAYMVGSTLPGEANMTPPWSFERTDNEPTSVEDQRKSYARRMFEMLPGYQDGGEVQPPMTDYVFPDRPRDYKPKPRSSAAIDLSQLGTQAGIVGAGFLPGAGVADYFGQFPSAQGGTEPSAVENFQQGNYGTATMQGLGAMGDLAMTVPVAGMAVGSVMKAPRAAQKMLQELPKTDELGFYSQVEKAVLDNPQKKGTGDQFLAQIQKTPGVKAEELQYTGLAQFLAGKPSVTKGEIQDYLDANKVQVQEVVLGGKQPFDQQRLLTLENEYANLKQHPIDDPSFGEEKYDEMIRLMNIRDQSTTDSLYNQAEASMRRGQRAQAAGDDASAGKYFKDYEMFNTRAEKLDLQDLGLMNPTKFSQYTLPGGTNYRELYLSLPAKSRGATDVEVNVVNDRLLVRGFDGLNEEQVSSLRRGGADALAMLDDFDDRLGIRTGDVIEVMQGGMSSDVYRVPAAHSVDSNKADINRLAQLRVNDRVVDGKNTLFIEEIQSDWHQAGRKQGYQTKDSFDVAETSPGRFVINNRADGSRVELPDRTVAFATREAAQQAIDSGQAVRGFGAKAGVPDAPFKTSWDELTLKRAIKLASDEGYDQVAFTTGKTQADRYKLSKSVNAIEVTNIRDNVRSVKIATPDNKDFILKVNQNGVVQSSINGEAFFVGKQLDEIIGKDMASEIMKSDSGKSFTGLDLDIGGEGMKGFYDKMLPKKLDKIGKKYGAKVGKTTMDTPDGPVEVWSMELPDDLKETVSTQGQPLFQLGAGAAGAAGIMSLTGEDAEAAQEP